MEEKIRRWREKSMPPCNFGVAANPVSQPQGIPIGSAMTVEIRIWFRQKMVLTIPVPCK